MISLLFFKAYIELLQFWERNAREQEQEAEARKRAGLHITTDVQTSLLNTPTQTPKRTRLPAHSRPSSLNQSAV